MKGAKWVGCFVLALAACILVYAAGYRRTDGAIDFTQPQPQQAQTSSTAEAPLRIAFASVISPKETRQSYQIIVNYIAWKQGRPAVLIQRRSYEELNKLMSSGGADIAFFSTGAYCAYQNVPPAELLAMAETNGSVYYSTYLITGADTDITDFSQLQGRTFAFTDPLSYSGRLAVDSLLSERGTSASTYFKRFFYTYNHDKSIWAVANHLADGASIDSQIYDFVRQTNPQLCQQIRIFAVLPEAPTGPVIMRRDLPEQEKDKLRQIFYTMHTDPSLQEAMKSIQIDAFVPPVPGAYDELRRQYALRMHRAGRPE